MELKRQGSQIVVYVDGENKGRIHWTDQGDGIVLADSTVVDPSLRGQGVAGKLFDRMLEEIEAEGKKIRPMCSYIVKKFEDPQYDYINADK